MKIIRRRSLLRYCATLFLISKHIYFGDNKRCFLSLLSFFYLYLQKKVILYTT